MMPDSGVMGLIIFAAYIAAGVAATTVAVWLLGRRDRFGSAGAPIIVALCVSAMWSIASAVGANGAVWVNLAESARNVAWLFVIYRLFASDGRHESLSPIRPLLVVLVLVEALHAGVTLASARVIDGQAGNQFLNFTIMFRLMLAVGALVLVHNLYAGASRTSQGLLRWPAAGLAAMWGLDLNLYTIAYLGGGWPTEIAASRALGTLGLAGLLAIGSSKIGSEARFKPSRAVTFQTFSLLVIGAYFVAMVAVAQWLSFTGGDFSRWVKLAFVTLACALAILVLPSRRLRDRLKVMLAKHFFQHRYDYRDEWMRFTRTIGNGGAEAQPLGERVIQAVADIAEAPAGLLLTPGDAGELVLAARWRWPAADVPGAALSARSADFFGGSGVIVDLDEVRAGHSPRGAAVHVPNWLREETRAWAMIPLIHYERLVGMVILARPPLARKFDWEDFDLLRVVGRQLASYLAEHAGQEALTEAARFDEFNRRIAFVMHDIKNLASQLSLLARNAELHAEKPEFRADMLVTLRNSADKLNALLARLSRYGGGVVDGLTDVQADAVVKAAVAHFQGSRRVILAQCQPCAVVANREALQQLLVHLVQNGVDASAPEAPVYVSLFCDGLHGRFEVVDSGSGMSPEFVRTKLFKPFVSSKPGGFGIGAYEARELARAMRGQLEVESREGLGTRFIIRLPLAAVSDLFQKSAEGAQRLAS